jgi:hypothetical protein
MLTTMRISGIETIAMDAKRKNRTSGAVAVLAIGSLIAASAVFAQSPDSAPAAQLKAASTGSAPTLQQQVKSLVAKLTPARVKLNREFQQASAQFPDFCKHWEQDLHDRETNNLSNLKFSLKDGFETAVYTGYGKIAGCESHQSRDGYSIGKITYEEFIYYIAGKSQDEARHATPKAISDTHTTEIFRWENNKWFY